MRASGAAALVALLVSGYVLGACAQGAKLTTRDQKNGPTIIVDGNGKEVTLKGIGWYGFNTGFTSVEGLRQGKTTQTMDINMVIYRMKMLGFNAIRLPMTFDNHWGLGQTPPVNYTVPCTKSTEAQIQAALTPPTFPSLPLAKSPDLPQTPPAVPGYCNADMPDDSTLKRYVWTVAQFVNEGFYVNVDYHSNNYTNDVANGDGSIFDKPTWTQTWTYLLETIVKSVPQAQGRLLIDLINEPDGFGLTWSVAPNSPVASLTSYYVDAINALYPVCPGCIFLVEGGGQANYCSTNWGNGFATSSAVVGQNGVSDATPFFQAVLNEPWLSQLVLAPHFYCPGVSLETRKQCYSGTGQWQGFDNTVGYLTVAPGFCANNGKCKVFAAIVDEFGSTLNSTIEDSCMSSILSYMAVAPGTGKHAPFTSWFYWAWQPDSLGTGGVVDDDWFSIRWDKIASLTGGTKTWTTGAGLQPWYLASFNSSAPTNQLDPIDPAFSVVSVTTSPPTPVTASTNNAEAAAVPLAAPATATWAAATEANATGPQNGVPAGAAAAGAVLGATLIALVVLVLA